jgi:UDP-N-acetylglucosamine 1-carboxyvinyltransferase
MHKFDIEGGARLNGSVAASGSKNAALPILFASILSDKKITLTRVPKLKDIDTTLLLLQGIGASTSYENGKVQISIPKLASCEAPYDLVRTMRASVLMLGPLLARAGKAKVSLPGGCAIGSRPVDLHLMGLEKMGAKLRLEQGYILGECPEGLSGAEIEFRMPSVGATENLMMAAVLAKGKTVIKNAAREPEISDLGEYLRKMGAKISGHGSSEIVIDGVNALKACEHPVMFDRIEAGTLLLSGPITGGKVKVTGVDANSLTAFLDQLKLCGVKLSQGSDWLEAEMGAQARGLDFSTEPFPGFPTDLQAQLMAFLAQLNSESVISETIFENRFMHVPELNRMGADIRVEGGRALIRGKSNCYQGAVVMATDLRASASLVLAALSAKGESCVRRIYHLDRGYEGLETKLSSLGAKVIRKKE